MHTWLRVVGELDDLHATIGGIARQERSARERWRRDDRCSRRDDWACGNRVRGAALRLGMRALMIRRMARFGIRASHVALLSIGIGAFFTAQFVVVGLAGGRPVSFVRDMLQEILYWLAWAALSPVIVAALRRWPWDARPPGATIARHAAVAATLVPVQTVMAFSAHFVALRMLGVVPAVSLVTWLTGRSSLLVWGGFEGLFFYAMIVAVYTVFHFRRLYSLERVSAADLAVRGAALETELARAQLDALRSQLRPHFLFNTLNAISVLTVEDPAKARSMLLRLGSLLRRSLDEEHHEVALQQELEFLNEYLDIQQVRFGDRLVVTSDIDPALLGVRVPVFLLQPLVENAITHGAVEKDGVSVIAIRAARTDRGLRITVQDNGAGPGMLAGTAEGIGLRNTRERLAQLYGEAATLDLTDASATSGRSGGCVEVVIPLDPVPACAS
jgi:hypothetical protein